MNILVFTWRKDTIVKSSTRPDRGDFGVEETYVLQCLQDDAADFV